MNIIVKVLLMYLFTHTALHSSRVLALTGAPAPNPLLKSILCFLVHPKTERQTEADMSNEIPQAGSIISLVSNAQIRYEGTLELIKMAPEESSLSLSSGRFFAYYVSSFLAWLRRGGFLNLTQYCSATLPTCVSKKANMRHTSSVRL